MKRVLKAAITIAFVVFLVSIAFNSGKRAGFRNGSQWAILQAGIVAREAGLVLPVYLHNGAFRVVFRQPPGLYKRAWRLADEFDRANKAKQDGEKTESTTAQTEF